jgi:hypothetical protein
MDSRSGSMSRRSGASARKAELFAVKTTVVPAFAA